MNLSKFNEMLLESVDSGLAIVAADSGAIVFGNRRFLEWFPGTVGVGQSLFELLPDLDRVKLESRIEAGRAYTSELTVQRKRRQLTLKVSISAQAVEQSDLLVVEIQNISKLKELEYMIESYAKMVEKQNRTVQREKERVEKLLLNVMPKQVYEELKNFGVTTPQRYEEASILMMDFVGFTDMAIAGDPGAVVSELNDMFTAFDRIAEQFGCERIKTAGDSYMAVSGIPDPLPDHATNIAKLAVLMRRYLRQRNRAHTQKWECRIGINTGVVIGSIIGVQKYVYDIFGPGVNLAARMEHLCEPMGILLCDDMYPLVKNEFRLTELESVNVKGFGTKTLYALDAEGTAIPVESPALPGF
ncbi:MAG: adenylate/guanylate cyclase domain-containing protein [Pseudomonadota bacterium]